MTIEVGLLANFRVTTQIIGNLRIEREAAPRGFLCRIWYGKQRNPGDNYRFQSLEAREKHIAERIAADAASTAAKVRRKQEARDYRHSYKPGDIFCWSWGWEQTNVNWFQVTAVTEKTVTIREIQGQRAPESDDTRGHSSMSDYCLPVKDAFLEPDPEHLARYRANDWTEADIERQYLSKFKPQVKKVGVGGYLSAEFGCMSAWDGRPHYRSWYA